MSNRRSTTPVWVRASLHRPITVLMLLISLAVVGVLAYQSIPLQLAPEGFINQTISVNIPVPDSTPSEVMEEVAEPAEELLRTIAGVSTIESRSSSSSCSIRVSYSSIADGDAVYADVRDRMERLLPTLPEGADRYNIFRFNMETDLPIIQMAVTYGDEIEDPDALLDNVIRPRVESIEGVTRVQVRGLVLKQVSVELDPQLVEAYAVDVRELIDRLRGDNVISPGGIVDEGQRRYLLRLSTRFSSFDEIRNYRINDSLKLGEVATVDYDLGLENFLVRVNGRRCKTLVVSKESEANTLEVCSAILAEVQNFPRDPRLATFEYFPYFNQGKVIEDSIDNLKKSCAWGGLLAIIVLYLFLRRLRVTFVVAAAIPLSLLIAVVVIFFTDGTFNVLSLTGLTLGIGMLIDNAIVISENIFRYRVRGESPRRAAELGVREVGLAVTLATLTTVAVFMPVIFLGGDSNIRVMLGELGLPVCYSVLASLLVALIFVPLTTTYLESEAEEGSGTRRGKETTRVTLLYRRLLDWVLRHRFAGVVIAVLVLSTTAFPFNQLKKQHRNQSKTRAGYLDVECPPHFSLLETDSVMEQVRKAFEPAYEELQVENVVAWFDRSGGTFAFFLLPGGATTRAQFMERLKPYVPEIPGVKVNLGSRNDSSEADQETWIRARGRDPRILMSLLSETGERLRSDPGILEIITPEDVGRDEVRVDIQRERAQRYGVDPSMAASLVSWALRGAPLSDYQSAEAELPFWIRYQGSEMESLGELYRVPVYSDSGQPISLVNFARFGVERGVPSIQRRGGRVESGMRIVRSPTVVENDLKIRAHRIFQELDVPDGYELVLENSGNQLEALKDLQSAGVFGLILIFLIMGVLFESFVLPACVIVSIPFLGVGSYWAIYLSGEAMGEVAYVGFVILLGVVVNNAIVLTDTINRFRRGGGDTRHTAILEAGAARLRPILMTACTTVVGLSPLVILPNPGEGLDYKPLAIIVMGGLTASTVFTLVLIPLVYTLLDDLRAVMSGAVRVVGRQAGADASRLEA